MFTTAKQDQSNFMDIDQLIEALQESLPKNEIDEERDQVYDKLTQVEEQL